MICLYKLSTNICNVAWLAEKVKVMSCVNNTDCVMNCVHTPTQRGIVRWKEESGHTVDKDLTGMTDF